MTQIDTNTGLKEMKKVLIQLKRRSAVVNDPNQRGSAIVISLFVLVLITVFVALALSRSSAEAAAVGNETAEARTFYAAQGSLEMMTRNFNKKFEVNLKPTSVDFDDVRTAPVPGLSSDSGGKYTFTQEVLQTSNSVPVVLTGGPFSGLYAKRDNWRLRTTATDTYGFIDTNITTNNGTQVQLTRNILNNLVPIFQFGIFYDDNLEFHPGPRFDFGGRVHSNGSIFLQASTGLYFSSKVSTANFIYTDTSKNGSPWTNWDDNVFVKNASGTYVQLANDMGSVQSGVNGAPVVQTPAPTILTIPNPVAYNRASWATNKALFDGNLIANSPLLQLPLKLNSDSLALNLDLNEVIKRGKDIGDLYNAGTHTAPNITAVTTATTTKDDAITAAERYYNKTGIRVSLADKRNRLPGCAAALDSDTVKCGVRLDGDGVGQTTGVISGPRGYLPIAMAGSPAYQATRINGDRFYSGTTGANAKETWIRIQTVIYNPATELYDTQDITQDILALGVTQVPISATGVPLTKTDTSFRIADANYYDPSTNQPFIDSRSIVKLQRFVIPGAAIPGGGTYLSNFTGNYNYVWRGTVPSGSNCNNTPTSSLTTTGADTGTLAGGATTPYFPNGFTSTGDNRASMRNAVINNITIGPSPCVVPFPINVFDTREGLYNDTTTTFDPVATYGTNVPWAGVMSMVDIDVANLKSFLDGTWDTKMPTTTPYYTATTHVLRGNDIPQPTNTGTKSGGWVFYVSDRRGDYDYDGEYDMEDVYGNNDGTLQVGEDVNKDGFLQADYTNEAPRYTGAGSNVSPDIAAVFDHKFYRRGVRLINGQTIPGMYDSTTPANTKGFTVASENGVYVLGNYNATGVVSHGTPTAYNDYLPADTSSLDIPASIASDAITVLSRSWQDSLSFTSPFNITSRNATETTMRFAILSGDTITSLSAAPNQGGGDLKMNGGVHNFKRFLEDWSSDYLNYSGSLINLYNSHNNNGTYKSGGGHVYNPPNRNWVFDATFLDINRLPPGTPYFQYVQTTGFERTNE